ncbi:MAG: hypothetical protein L6R43_04560 [Planctomycetes bacterium]|nr:hypothetical protein [Planctomycetota bacterium]
MKTTEPFTLLRVAPFELGWVCLSCLRDAEEDAARLDGTLVTLLWCPSCWRTAELPSEDVREAWNEAVARQVRLPK